MNAPNKAALARLAALAMGGALMGCNSDTVYSTDGDAASVEANGCGGEDGCGGADGCGGKDGCGGADGCGGKDGCGGADGCGGK